MKLTRPIRPASPAPAPGPWQTARLHGCLADGWSVVAACGGGGGGTAAAPAPAPGPDPAPAPAPAPAPHQLLHQLPCTSTFASPSARTLTCRHHRHRAPTSWWTSSATATARAGRRDAVTGYDAADSYTPGATLQVDAATGAAVFTGAATAWNGRHRHHRATAPGGLTSAALTTPGTYQVVDSSGNVRSSTFKIEANVYHRPVLIQAIAHLLSTNAPGQDRAQCG